MKDLFSFLSTFFGGELNYNFLSKFLSPFVFISTNNFIEKAKTN